MTPLTVLRLGRVSNLPTVWTNAMAGAVLAAGAGGATAVGGWAVAGAALTLSLFYIGGMWLNDAYDAEIDAGERSARPIPAGEVARGIVFAVGFALLGLGIVLALFFGWRAGLAALALALVVILYDWSHKRTVLAPLIMGAARFLSYVFAAAALGVLGGDVLLGAAGLAAHVVGLTYAARQEAYDRLDRAWPLAVLAVPLAVAAILSHGLLFAGLLWLGLVGVTVAAIWLLFRRRPGDVPRAVVTMIAGIALYDAVLIAGVQQHGAAFLALLAFGATLLLQRVVPGT